MTFAFNPGDPRFGINGYGTGPTGAGYGNPLFGNTLTSNPGYGTGNVPDPSHPAMRGVLPQNLQTEWDRYTQFGGTGGNPWSTQSYPQGGGNPLLASSIGSPVYGTGSMMPGNPQYDMAQLPAWQQPQGGPTQYGYGQAPGQGGYGYYEQQTPAGSFAAANQQFASPGSAQTFQANNPYIGQNSQGIRGVGSVAQGVSQFSNPWLGQNTQQANAASNSMAGVDNPYLGRAIDAASADASRNYNQTIAPRRLARMQASGSFGNTGQQEAELEDQRNFGQTLGNIATNARLGDYYRQQDLAENLANRQTGVSTFNSGLGAGDLNRNMLGALAQYNANTGYGLDAAKFDASTGLGTQQFNAGLGAADLARNSNLMQNMGQFNAGALNAGSQFNAGLGQQANMFNAGQGNAMNMYNTGAANNMLENFRNRSQRADEFNQGMDFNTWQANMGNMSTAQRDQMNFLGQLLGFNATGINQSTNQQNAPMNYWQQFSNSVGNLAGNGGSVQQLLQANPWLAALGGWQLGNVGGANNIPGG